MTQINTHQAGNIIVFGASGHAKVVIDIIEKMDVSNVIYLADDNPALKGKSIYGYTVIGGKDEVASQNCDGIIVAIGDNKAREHIARWLEMNSFILTGAAVHPSAQLARGVDIGLGSVVMAGGVVNSDTMIGKNTIVNTGATIDHDCVIGKAVHIAPGATICGGVSIGDVTLIGAGAIILPNVKLGKNVIVGAGSTVIGNVADNTSVVGTPAEVIS